MNSAASAAFGGRLDRRQRRVRPAVPDVGPHAVGEQEAVLEHDTDALTEGVEGDVAQVRSAEPDRAVLHVVEAREQERHGRLARSRGTDEGERLARGHPQADVLEHGLVGGVTERHVVELDVDGPGRERRRVRCVHDRRPRVDDLEHTEHAGLRLLADREQSREHPDRSDHHGQVGREREERAEGDRPLEREVATEAEDPDLSQRGKHLHERVVEAVEPDGAHPGGEEPPRRVVEAVELVLLLAEALDDADTGDRRLDDSGHLPHVLLGVPVRREELAAAFERHDPQGWTDEERHDRQHRRQRQHQDDRHDEEQDVRELHRHHAEQALDQVEVRDGPAHDLSGLQVVLLRAVEAFQ